MFFSQCKRNKAEQCYVLDDNAYILSDPDAEHTGKFFGSVEQKLMHILIEDKVYTPIKIYDYQAVCYKDRMVDYKEIMKQVSRNSALSTLFWNPFKYFATIVTSLLTTVYTLPSFMANCEYHLSGGYARAFLTPSFTVMYPDPEHLYNAETLKNFYCNNVHEEEFMNCLKKFEVENNDTSHKKYKFCHEEKEVRYKKCNEENGTEFIMKRHLIRTRPFKCDKVNKIYSLTKDESNFLKLYDECSRPFVVRRIAHSNLILLITARLDLNRNCAQVFSTEFDDVPKTIEYLNSTFCHKVNTSLTFRNRPKSCMTHNNKVSGTYTGKKLI